MADAARTYFVGSENTKPGAAASLEREGRSPGTRRINWIKAKSTPDS